METIEFWIVEDDVGLTVSLEALLRKLGYHKITPFTSAEAALQCGDAHGWPDFAILDIHLEGIKTGLDIGAELSAKGVGLVFVSAFADEQLFAQVKAFDNTFALLEKPIQEISLISVIESGVKTLREKNISERAPFLIKDKGVYYKVNPQEVDYLESDGNYTAVYVNEKKFFIKYSMVKLIEKMTGVEFIRVHQKVYVNVKKIRCVNLSEKTVSGERFSVPIGRAYKDDLMDRFRML